MQKCWLKKMAYRIAGPKYFNPKKRLVQRIIGKNYWSENNFVKKDLSKIQPEPFNPKNIG